MVQEQYISPEEEIRALEEKLAQKKKELESQGTQVEQEKDVLREVLKQHIEKVRPSVSGTASDVTASGGASSQPVQLSDDLKQHATALKEKEKREEQIRALVEIAMTRSIQDAVRIAESATPYLIDELHDHLVDDYYDKLVALRKLKVF